MSPTTIDRLRAIKTLASLVAYLRDDLDWPIDSDDVEDITFDYTSAELGLAAEAAVRIKEIKQLRPLSGQQPWGIFWVNFEKKRLPVVVMRLILRALVLKKRADASRADRQSWAAHDLLFISAYGEESDRAVTFAHFVENPGSNLAELRVLGWDDDDTPLKMDYVARMLHDNLRWDDKLAARPDEWRQRWSDAFHLRHRHVVRTSQELAATLAALAQRIRSRIRTVLRSEDGFGEMRKLQSAFRTGLIHDLDDEGFADMFAQTVTYGLFSLAVRRTVPGNGTAFTKDDLPHYFTSPFLAEMLGVFLGLKSRKGAIDFDELGVSDVTDLLTSPDTHMEVVLADFNNKTRGEDPVIHFYEHFLTAYNKQLKVQRGVFYTPQPVVSYIVRSVHELLQTEFGLTDGLADTTTWGEMLKKHPGLKLPPLSDEPGEKRTISPDEPFVQILDPATGTATFLVEVIDVIHRTLTAKWKQQRLTDPQQRAAWNDYVPQHLLPRLHAFELMMAPYAIAHMKVGLKLAETGYRFGTEERARIYLTNALEPKVKQLPQIGFDALAHEAAAVNEIKWYKRFTVIIGNPPYSKSSGNRSEAAERLVQSYKDLVAGETNVQPLSDDYVKFIAYALKNAVNEASILGMITNRSFLDGLIHRGMRKTLLASSSKIIVSDLHGDSNVGEVVPAGRSNENVFDITQGVAVSVLVRKPHPTPLAEILHTDVWGTRAQKYQLLENRAAESGSELACVAPYFFFAPKDLASQSDQAGWISIEKMFVSGGMGVKSRRDHFLIDQDRDALQRRFQLLSEARDVEKLREDLAVTDNEQWTLKRMRDLVRRIGVNEGTVSILYRPFDTRFIWYHREAIERGDSRWPVMKHVLPDNLSLLTSRQSINGDFTSVFIARGLSEMKTAESTRGSYVFPVFTASDQGDLLTRKRGGTNMRLELFAPHLRKKQPAELLSYVYAVLHSPNYRHRYAGALRIEFPKIPSSCPGVLFGALSKLGGELTALHLLESPKLAQPITEFIGGRNAEVEKISWSRKTVWLDKAETTGFRGVREEVWNFHIGGYQVCQKWLKDRKGRTLSKDDIAHYHKIVVALTETIRLMAEIDQTIEAAGGWPSAFVTPKGGTPQ